MYVIKILINNGMSIMSDNANLIKEIKSIKAREIRDLIPKECYIRSNKKTFFFSQQI